MGAASLLPTLALSSDCPWLHMGAGCRGLLLWLRLGNACALAFLAVPLGAGSEVACGIALLTLQMGSFMGVSTQVWSSCCLVFSLPWLRMWSHSKVSILSRLRGYGYASQLAVSFASAAGRDLCVGDPQGYYVGWCSNVFMVQSQEGRGTGRQLVALRLRHAAVFPRRSCGQSP